MKEYTYYFWTFMFGSFMGVIIETLWCMLKNKKIESRKGLIFGPFNPLYGFAAAVLSFSFRCMSEQTIGRMFLIGIVVPSSIEYLCSYYQEKITGRISWNYQKFRWNLNGRINLIYSLMWGVLSIYWFSYFIPIIDEAMPFFYEHSGMTIFVSVMMALDCFISLAASIRRKQRQKNIYAKTKFLKHIDYIYTDELMDKIYPNSECVDEEPK